MRRALTIGLGSVALTAGLAVLAAPAQAAPFRPIQPRTDLDFSGGGHIGVTVPLDLNGLPAVQVDGPAGSGEFRLQIGSRGVRIQARNFLTRPVSIPPPTT